MTLKTSHRIILTVAVLIAGIGIILAIVAIPSFSGIIKLSQSIEEERARIEKTVTSALRLQKTTEYISEINRELPKLEAMIIDYGKEIELFSFLEQKSRAHGLAETLRLGEAQKGPADTQRLDLDIELRGSFTGVMRFISDIEQSPILFPIREISLRLLEQAPEAQSEFIANLKGSIYVKNSP